MRTIMLIVFFCLFIKGIATVQSKDRLIYKSDTLYINNYPLDTLIKIFPAFDKRIQNYSKSSCVSSACWRGYIATWSIQSDSLYLVKLINGCEDITFKLNRLFKKRKTIQAKIFADWFSGEISAQYDFKMLRFGSFERYMPTKLLIARIADGKIIELVTQNIDYDENLLPNLQPIFN